MTLKNNQGTRSRFQLKVGDPARLSLVLVLFMMGCVGIPENVKPVDHFQSREPKITEHLKQTLIAKASAAGFDISQLIFVDHEQTAKGEPGSRP